jgi:hypothetical protein
VPSTPEDSTGPARPPGRPFILAVLILAVLILAVLIQAGLILAERTSGW